MLKLLILLGLFNAAWGMEINEPWLLEKLSSSPDFQQSQARKALENGHFLETEKAYSPQLELKSDYQKTNERPLINFQPIFSPTLTTEAAISKKWSKGMTLKGGVGWDKKEFLDNGAITEKNTTIFFSRLQMDLWKNLWGRLDEAQLLRSEYKNSWQETQAKIEQYQLGIRVRNLYWQLVANKEAQKISLQILETTKRQAQDTRNRLKNSISDQGDLARSLALVADREGQLTYLRYQENLLWQELKKVFPILNQESQLTLAPYDLEKAITEVMMCTEIIAKQEGLPLQDSLIHQSMDWLEKIYAQNQVIENRTADWDVTLNAEIKSTGIGNSTSQSFDDQRDQNRLGHAIGVSINIPLGKTPNQLEKTRLRYYELQFRSDYNKLKALTESTHSSTLTSIKLLQEVIKAQATNSIQLKARLEDIRKKYSQARVKLNDLINDENALLSNELNTINTKLTVITTLLDYFETFQSFACPFNRGTL